MTMTMERLMNGMTKEEVIATIEALKKGAAYSIEYKDGTTITRKDGSQIISTIVMDARFKINYGNTKLTKAANAIRWADSVEKMMEAEDAVNKLNTEEWRCLSKKLQEEYSAKKLAMANKQPLWVTPKKDVERKTDEKYPYIAQRDNGNEDDKKIELSVTRAYLWDLQKKDFKRPIRKYYMINKNKVKEISPETAKTLTAATLAVENFAGEKPKAPTPFYSINIKNICGIYKKRG